MRKLMFAGTGLLFLFIAALSGCGKPPPAPDSTLNTVPFTDQPPPDTFQPPPPNAEVLNSPEETVPDKAPQTRNRYLLVGINAYPGAGLQGCINDVHSMAAFLKEVIGAKDEEIVILTDAQGTAKNIKKWLAWLVQDARAGDRRLYHFSGHGAEFDGGGRPVVGSQPDGLNQVECTVDFDWTPEHMIQDWEFNTIFAKMPDGVIFNWVSDSCHSGDLTRVLPPPGVISMTAKAYPIVPPAIAARLEAKRSVRALYKPAPLHVGYVGGCDYNQTSADVRANSGAYGAATHYLIEQLRKTPKDSLKNNVIAVRKVMKRDQFDQVLQYEGLRVGSPFMT